MQGASARFAINVYTRIQSDIRKFGGGRTSNPSGLGELIGTPSLVENLCSG